MSKDNSALVFLAGLGVGVAATLLFAPASGSELRSRLRNGAGKTGDYLKQQANSMMEPLEDAVAAGKRAFNETVSNAMSGLNAASDVFDKSKDLAHQAGKTIEKGGKRLQEA